MKKKFIPFNFEMVFSLKSSVTSRTSSLSGVFFLQEYNKVRYLCHISSVLLELNNSNRHSFAWLDKIVKSLKNLPKHKVVANLCENALIGAHCQQTVWAKCGTTTFKQKCQVWECQILGGGESKSNDYFAWNDKHVFPFPETWLLKSNHRSQK